MTSTDAPRYRVLTNHEGQHALLPATVPVPARWSDTGFLGTEAECIDHVDARWTDLRPLSLRRALEE
ncbi:MbtH family NRPS accessory protein [Kitasatospora acidiphila]|uniref:MbtH family NRPS accessory protein n=1 Tax=Kitasatospora acidiphila TaxID=2567942 RepID=A0A540VYV5_9ACTN|nr:MbtH family NRPS accessory protein [Kitasatospora acidiphila]TQF01907.1 MbtH family NRPS accessory protein [Kitasatospora acidiphila]